MLSCIMLTLSLRSQTGGKICLTPTEMDYFLMQDLKAKKAVLDSATQATVLKQKNVDISLLKANEYDLKEQVRLNKLLAANNQLTATENFNKYNKEKKKAGNIGKILIGSLAVNIGFIAGFIVLLK